MGFIGSSVTVLSRSELRFRHKDVRRGLCRRSPPVQMVESPGAMTGTGGVGSVFESLSEATRVGSMVEALCRERKVSEAIQAVREMQEKGLQVSLQTRSVLIDAAVTSGGGSLLMDALEVLGSSLAHYGLVNLSYQPMSTLQALPEQQSAGNLAIALAFITLNVGSVGFEAFDAVTHRNAYIPTDLLILEAGILLWDTLLGDGKALKSIREGLALIFSEDPVRSCRVEAAYFLVAYLLGIPLLCYRPGKVAVKTMREFASDKESVDKLFVWFLAGPAAENLLDKRLVESNVNTVKELVSALNPEVKKQSGLKKIRERKERTEWAMAEATKLLENFSKELARLEKRMLSGASVGECIELLES